MASCFFNVKRGSLLAKRSSAGRSEGRAVGRPPEFCTVSRGSPLAQPGPGGTGLKRRLKKKGSGPRRAHIISTGVRTVAFLGAERGEEGAARDLPADSCRVRPPRLQGWRGPRGVAPALGQWTGSAGAGNGSEGRGVVGGRLGTAGLLAGRPTSWATGCFAAGGHLAAVPGLPSPVQAPVSGHCHCSHGVTAPAGKSR